MRQKLASVEKRSRKCEAGREHLGRHLYILWESRPAKGGTGVLGRGVPLRVFIYGTCDLRGLGQIETLGNLLACPGLLLRPFAIPTVATLAWAEEIMSRK